jgi:biopolymer transport protein ExbB
MKFFAVLVSGFLAFAPVYGQERSGELLAQNRPPVQGRGAADAGPAPANAPGSNDDTMVIPSNTARPIDEPFNGRINTVNLWKLVQSGGWAMIPLAFLSILTVMLVLVYLFTLRRSSILTPHYMNTADVLLKKRDYLGLLAISSRHSEAVARVVQRTLDFATKNPNASFEMIKDIAETEGGAQAASLQHRTVYLADIGMLSPMIGLLGTVMGIIRSFGVLGSGQTTQSRDVLLASGVSEALVATATGLILGILAMGFYSMFRNRVQSLISDMEIASAHVLALIAINYNKKREQSRVALEDEF